MTKGRKRKTKKFVQYYGANYVEKFEEEKRRKKGFERFRRARRYKGRNYTPYNERGT